MAKLVFGMNQSVDGSVDHMAFAPSPTLPPLHQWGAEEQAFAARWRNLPKWVVSRSLKLVGPNARLVGEDLEGAMCELKAERDGEIEVAGPTWRKASPNLA